MRVVILDNLVTHKSPKAVQVLKARRCWMLFLPAYSPDLNPIEMIFAKVKHLLRSLECRSRDELWHAMQQVLEQVTADDAINCFRHCGYTLQME